MSDKKTDADFLAGIVIEHFILEGKDVDAEGLASLSGFSVGKVYKVIREHGGSLPRCRASQVPYNVRKRWMYGPTRETLRALVRALRGEP